MPQGVPKETTTCQQCGDEFKNVHTHWNHWATDCQPPDEPEDEQRTYSGYKDAYTSYYGTSWEDVRQRVLDRDDRRCQGCGITNAEHRERGDLFPPDGGLHVHHKDKAKNFDSHDDANSLDNLVALCADCHRDAEN